MFLLVSGSHSVRVDRDRSTSMKEAMDKFRK
jgi:hypothetical protein